MIKKSKSQKVFQTQCIKCKKQSEFHFSKIQYKWTNLGVIIWTQKTSEKKKFLEVKVWENSNENLKA